VSQFKAQLQNAQVTLQRTQSLLKTPAGQQSAVDLALANQQALQAQVLGAEAQLQQAKINLDYTEIRAPIDGKIGRTAVTPGNYVSPGTGTLVSIVSQDPMFVVFPVPTRIAIELQSRSAEKKDDNLLIRLRLPDGSMYDHAGALDFVDNTVAGNTDTMILRGIIANPRLTRFRGGIRALVDGELVTVILEDTEKTDALAVPRAAVLTDQEGDYVYVVGADNKAQQRRVKLGQSTPAYAAVLSGLTEGENVIVDGIQRVRPGQVVAPGPAAAQLPPPAGGSR
jgi:membrane fusion protein, multidrug efflux system